MEVLVYKVVELLADVAEANIILLFVGIFTVGGRISAHWKEILGCGIGMGIVCFAMDQVALMSWVKTFLLFGGDIILSYKIYKERLLKIFLWIMVYIALFMPMEFISLYVSQRFSGTYMGVYLTWSEERVIAIITMKIVEVMMIIFCYINRRKKEKLEMNGKLMQIVVVVMGYIVVMLALYTVNYQTGKFKLLATLLCFAFAMGMVIFLLYAMLAITVSLENCQRVEWMQMQNEILQKNLEETRNSYAHWEKSIHDYKNTIVCLESMLRESEHTAIREYLTGEMEQMATEEHAVDCGNMMVSSIVNAKWIQAEDKGIFFSVQGKVSEHLPISEIAFGRIIGNLLDNALESAVCSETEPYVEIELNQTDFLLSVSVINSATAERIDFTKSSKGKRSFHGIGLRSIRANVAENGGIFTIKQKGERVLAKVEFKLKHTNEMESDNN